MTKTPLHEPFAGVLTLPDRQPFGTVAPVSVGAGEPLAMIRWHRWSMRANFDILAADGEQVLASGGKESLWGRQYRLTADDGKALLGVRFGFWGVSRPIVTLPDGRELTGRGNWTARKFSVLDSTGAMVAQLATTTGVLSVRPQSFSLDLLTPVLSIVQAAGLAQCLRAAIEEQNSSASVAATS